jgi:hypothetical protein
MIIEQWLEFAKLLVLPEVCKRKFGRLGRHRAIRKRGIRITFPRWRLYPMSVEAERADPGEIL